MNWSQWLTVTKGTSQDSPVLLKAEVTVGTLEEVKIYFPPGCLGYVKATLFHFEDQILPRDPQGYIAGDNYCFVLPMDYELESKPVVLWWKCWNTAIVNDHDIYLEIFVRELVPETTLGVLQRIAKVFTGE